MASKNRCDMERRNLCISKIKCSALILAGGRSSRMGEEKALLQVEEETLLQRSVRFWQNCGFIEHIFVSVGSEEHLKRLEPLPEGIRTVTDLLPGSGPMAGILSAFRQTDAETLFVSAVDMPYLRHEGAELLWQELWRAAGRRNAAYSDGEECQKPFSAGSGQSADVTGPDAAVFVKDGRPEPLFGIYRRTAAPAAERLLRAECRKMRALLESIETIYYPAPKEFQDIFRNINTPEDFENLMKKDDIMFRR